MTLQVIGVVALLACAACTGSATVRHSDLVEILGVQQWVLPHQEHAWSLDVVDPLGEATGPIQTSYKSGGVFNLMPKERDGVYRYWFRDASGRSSGQIRLDVCDNPDNVEQKCDAGQIDITFHDVLQHLPRRHALLVADISSLDGRRKQLVLVPANE